MTFGDLANVVRLVLTVACVVAVVGTYTFDRTHDATDAVAASFATAIAGLAAIVRRLRASRAIQRFDRGTVDEKIFSATLVVVACAGIIALELLAYALTNARLVEGLVVLVIGVPSAALLFRAEFRRLTTPKTSECGSLRTNLMCYAALLAVTLRTLASILGHARALPNLSIELVVAADMLCTALFPVLAYFTYDRYRIAKASPA